MQLTAVNGYLKPDDTEKTVILKRLKEVRLMGNDGMTLVIAGGLGPRNIGINMKILGTEGSMFLAGTSVYSHPDGATSGVKSIILAHRAYQEKGITAVDDLINYAKSLGEEGRPLLNALSSG
jgi:ribulose 1,5-bisphosphate carboxylase large subunit-like protein